MTIAALDVVKDLRKAFSARSLTGHQLDSSVRVHQLENSRIFVIFDPRISHQLLSSGATENQNYFSANLAQLESKGRGLPRIEAYFENAPLFKDGGDHRKIRAKVLPMIHRSCEQLRAQTPEIVDRACRRLRDDADPLKIATHVVERCFARVILSILDLPPANVLRALRNRASVFHFHFHPGRHRDMNHSLELLTQGLEPSLVDRSSLEWNVAESLLVMGVDPTIAAITAAILEDHPGPFSEGIQRYAPTSFVSRLCIRPINIGSHTVEAGDVCYLSLIGPASESLPSFPFGAGPHICIGKPLSILVCDIAEKVYRRLSPRPSSAPGLDAFGDGTFLSFKPQKT